MISRPTEGYSRWWIFVITKYVIRSLFQRYNFSSGSYPRPLDLVFTLSAYLMCVFLVFFTKIACRIYQVEIEGEEQPENSTTANSTESERGVTETQTKLVAQKAVKEEQHQEIKENKVLSEKDSFPSSEIKGRLKS